MQWLAFAGCCLIWGSTFLVIRIGNEAVAPIWAAAIRLFLAAAVLSVAVKVTKRRFPKGAALKATLQYGFFQFGLSFACLYWGEKFAPSAIAAVIFGTMPLIMAIFASLLGLEVLKLRKFIASIVALMGVAVIFSSQLQVKFEFLPLLSILAAAMFASLGSLFLKRGPRQPILPVNALGAWVGGAVCLIISLAFGESHALPQTTAAWFPIIYLTVAGSLGAYLLVTWLLSHWPATRVSYITVVIPIIAVLLGHWIRGEHLGETAWIGALLVMGALMVGR